MPPRQRPEFERLAELVSKAIQNDEVMDQSFKAAQERHGQTYLEQCRKASRARPSKRAADAAQAYRDEVTARAILDVGRSWLDGAKKVLDEAKG
ncbi:MAG TPA: hypothetical protein VM388_10905 [Acidimicrobiales bacterium]|nr:hypothetical protein [Acidimicrobiales bacterium]